MGNLGKSMLLRSRNMVSGCCPRSSVENICFYIAGIKIILFKIFYKSIKGFSCNISFISLFTEVYFYWNFFIKAVICFRSNFFSAG